MSTPEGEPLPTYFTGTCRTAECAVQDQAFRVPCYPCAVPPTWRVICGQCGQPVTDLVPA